jgi:hypothetical protein
MANANGMYSLEGWSLERRQDLLRSMCEHQARVGIFAFIPAPPVHARGSPHEWTEGFIDYYCGRAIKMDLSADRVNPCNYDRENGDGAFGRRYAEFTAK